MSIASFALRPGKFAALAVLATIATACGDSTAPLVPAAIQIVAGDQQTATPGATVSVAPSVKILSASGKAVPGVKVTFTAGPQHGTVAGNVQRTDASGIATVTSWKLGTKAGTDTLTVSVDGVAPVYVTAVTSAGSPASFNVVQGAVQAGTVGAPLAVPPTVRVADAYDNGVSGVAVTFALANGGTIEKTQTTTDANGVASTGVWTLGPLAGTQTLTATASDLANLQLSATAAPDVAAQLAILVQPSTTAASGSRLSVQPALEFRDRFGNAVAPRSAQVVSAAIASGNGTLGGTTSVTATTPRVQFTDLSFTGTGSISLRFTTPGFADAMSAAFAVAVTAQCPGTPLDLDMQLGQSLRFQTTSSSLPRCLEFSAARNAGQQYMVLFENVSPYGNYDTGLFSGAPTDDGNFRVSVSAAGPIAGSTVSGLQSSSAAADVNAEALDTWNFDGKPAYEAHPALTGSAPRAQIKQNGSWIAANGSMATPRVGDTLSVFLEGIPRLNVPQGNYPAIIRYVDSNIVIAEDLRITNDTTFKRASGARNTPIADADLQQIATEYATYAKVQADRLFNGRYNNATETDPGRPIAVHTLMYSDNIWGYTYANTNYFAWDYWVNSSDGITKTLYQHPQRNADDLFMHEIAHIRHWGLLERAGRTGAPGNQWLVEGFARFSERLPIDARLLANQDFTRTGNAVLPLNPAWAPVFFVDDIPSYWYASFNMFGGYTASAFVFDYFADQVAGNGGDWRTALADLITNAGTQTDANRIVNSYLGIDFGTLFTRARVALYTDDIGTPGLPAWTQYLQLQLRASRTPANTPILLALDPRAYWSKIVPGSTFTDADHAVPTGGAFGYVIDGTTPNADAQIEIDPVHSTNGIMTVVRIK